MAQQLYPINLKDPYFPLLSELQGRTVIGATVGKAPAQDERPSIAYCHNIMPVKEGYSSVAYLPIIPAIAGAVSPLSDVRIVYGDAFSKLYMVWDSLGSVFVLLEGSTTWVAIPATSPVTGGSSFSPDDVTIGTVNGISYIFYSGIGAFTFNESTNTLDAVILTGLAISDVLGVTSSAGYLVAYTRLAIAWSSTLTPTDFTPSSVIGAGGGNVAGLAGSILFIVSNTLGLLIYSKANVVAGTFTGNVQFPWKFRQVPGAGGGISLDLIAYEAESADQYVFSKAGLQSVTSQRAEVILPEITDFLAGRRFEDFDEVTREYVVTDIPSGTLKKKIKYIASRYLVISYGLTEFTHAIVVDTAIQRLGKLKITHTDIFEYIGAQGEVSKESLAVLLADGSVSAVDFSYQAASSGVLILGKLQATYSKLLTLLGVEVENIDPDSEEALTVVDRAALDGKNTTNITGAVSYSQGKVKEYVFRTTAKNHSLALIGKINAVTVLVRYFVAGRR